MIKDPKETRKLIINGKDVNIWIYGDINKGKIFFIHGYPRSFSKIYGDLPIRFLRHDYCVAAFDLPGFGESKNINLNPELFIKQIAELVARNEKIFLFGTSYGGSIALLYAALYPKKVSSVIVSWYPLVPTTKIPKTYTFT